MNMPASLIQTKVYYRKALVVKREEQRGERRVAQMVREGTGTHKHKNGPCRESREKNEHAASRA